jgi:hypothetical protein
MNYLFILKKEKNDIIKKYNNIKKWFINNSYLKMNATYIYDDEINISNNNLKNLYIISPNIFPMLNSIRLDDIFKIKNSICDDCEYPIICLELNESIKLNSNKKISLEKLYNLLNFFENRIKGLVIKYEFDKIHNLEWFYIDNYKIPDFLNDMKNRYFTWEHMNEVKLNIAHRYPKIIYYDGKNKYESKKMVENWNIKVPKTYKQFLSLKEITQDKINNLPTCIIKPTNWDGGKYVFKNFKDYPISALDMCKQLRYFYIANRKKEIMSLILRSNKPSIIAEEYIVDSNSNYTSPNELKFYVFNGKILFILASNQKVCLKKFSFFDENFNKFKVEKYSFPENELNFKFEKPYYFEKLKKDVLIISQNFYNDMKNTFIGKFIRIDFFINKENYWFGEFSLFPNGGKGDNLNDFGKKEFIKNWIPEVFQIFDE